MAEISQGGGEKKKGGKVRSKKSSTRIDMTPMVDLAFLLLTFFVMTTTLNKPQTMEITMPEKPKAEDEVPKVNEREVLTLVLGGNDKVYWYTGITDPKVEVANFSATGIRKILVAKKKEIPKLVVLIKAPPLITRFAGSAEALPNRPAVDGATLASTRTWLPLMIVTPV